MLHDVIVVLVALNLHVDKRLFVRHGQMLKRGHDAQLRQVPLLILEILLLNVLAQVRFRVHVLLLLLNETLPTTKNSVVTSVIYPITYSTKYSYGLNSLKKFNSLASVTFLYKNQFTLIFPYKKLHKLRPVQLAKLRVFLKLNRQRVALRALQIQFHLIRQLQNVIPRVFVVFVQIVVIIPNRVDHRPFNIGLALRNELLVLVVVVQLVNRLRILPAVVLKQKINRAVVEIAGDQLFLQILKQKPAVREQLLVHEFLQLLVILPDLLDLHRVDRLLKIKWDVFVLLAVPCEIAVVENEFTSQQHLLVDRGQILEGDDQPQRYPRVAKVVLIALLLLLLQIQRPPHFPVALNQRQQRRVDV